MKYTVYQVLYEKHAVYIVRVSARACIFFLIGGRQDTSGKRLGCVEHCCCWKSVLGVSAGGARG